MLRRIKVKEPGARRSNWLAWSAVIPALYFLGFVSWSIYFSRLGVSSHLLPASQYLMSGAVGASLFAVPLLVDAWAWKHGLLENSMQSSRIGWNATLLYALLRTLLSAIGFLVLASIYLGIELLRMNSVQLLFACMGVVVFLFVVPVFMWLVGRMLSGREVKPAHKSTAAVRRLGHYMRPFVLLAIPICTVFLTAVSTMGFLMMENLSPAYGGAGSEQVRLAVNPEALPFSMAEDLGLSANGTVAWTPVVDLRLMTSSEVLFSFDGSLHELRRDVIVAIDWHPEAAS